MLRFLTGINPLFTYLKMSVVLLFVGGLFLLSTIGLLFVGAQWNLAGEREWNGVVALVLQFFGLVSGALIQNYVLAWFLGFLRGQPGGEKGFSINDGVNMGAEYATAAKNGWVAICFWISMPWLVLFLIDFRGMESALLLVLVLSIPALFGSILIYPDSKMFRNAVYWVEVVILIVIVAIGVYNTAWRSTTSEEGQEATEVDRIVAKRYAKQEREVLRDVLEKAKSFDPKKGETLEATQTRFVASLTERERAVYLKSKEIAKGETETARAEKSIKAGKDGLERTRDWLLGNTLQVTYTLTSLTTPRQLCGFPARKKYSYKIVSPKMLVRYRQTGQYDEVNLNGGTIETGGLKLPVGGINRGWALTLNKVLPGETVQVDESGCLNPQVNLPVGYAQAYDIAEADGQAQVKIEFQANKAWTWRDLAMFVFMLAAIILVVKGIKWLWRLYKK